MGKRLLKKISLDDFFATGLYIPFLANFVAGLTMAYYAPLISEWLDQKNYSSSLIGLVGTVGMLGALIFVKQIPKLMHFLDIQRSFFFTVFSLPLLFILIPYVDSIYFILLIRFIHGVIFSLYWLVNESWVILGSTSRSRSTYFSFYVLIDAIGFTLGPQLLHFVNMQNPLSFALGFFAFAPLFILFLMVPKKNLPQLKSPEVFPSDKIFFRIFSLLPLAFLSSFMCGFVESVFSHLILPYANVKGLGSEFGVWILGSFAAGNLVFQLPIALLAKKIKTIQLLRLNSFIALAAIILWQVFFDKPFLCYLISLILGASVAAFYTIGLIFISEFFEKKMLTRANMLYIFFFTAGAVLGPSLLGTMIDLNPDLFASALSFLLACFFFSQFYLQRGEEQHD